MQITDIRVKKISSEGKMKAVVSVTFDDAFVVHDIKVIEGQDKLFTAMPSRKTPENEFKDIAHPINSQMRELLEKAIIEKYNEVAEEVARVKDEIQNQKMRIAELEKIVSIIAIIISNKPTFLLAAGRISFL